MDAGDQSDWVTWDGSGIADDRASIVKNCLVSTKVVMGSARTIAVSDAPGNRVDLVDGVPVLSLGTLVPACHCAIEAELVAPTFTSMTSRTTLSSRMRG